MPRQFLCLTCGHVTMHIRDDNPRCEACGRGNGLIEPTQEQVQEFERKKTPQPSKPQ